VRDFGGWPTLWAWISGELKLYGGSGGEFRLRRLLFSWAHHGSIEPPSQLSIYSLLNIFYCLSKVREIDAAERGDEYESETYCQTDRQPTA